MPFIYALVDPHEPEHLRYVGVATRKPDRPYSHAKLANANPSTLLHRWILSLQEAGRGYSVVLLRQFPEPADRKEMIAAEKNYMISAARAGHRLLNYNEHWAEDEFNGKHIYNYEVTIQPIHILRNPTWFKEDKTQRRVVVPLAEKVRWIWERREQWGRAPEDPSDPAVLVLIEEAKAQGIYSPRAYWKDVKIALYNLMALAREWHLNGPPEPKEVQAQVRWSRATHARRSSPDRSLPMRGRSVYLPHEATERRRDTQKQIRPPLVEVECLGEGLAYGYDDSEQVVIERFIRHSGCMRY